MSGNYQLTEENELLVYEARYQLQFIIDLTQAVPPGKQLDIDPEGLAAFLSSVQRKLPNTKDMVFVMDSPLV